MLLNISSKRPWLWLMLLAMAAPLCAQDIHWSYDPASTLYKRSAFAHGYIHGYEMGFHTGNFDYQMSREARDPKKLRDFKRAKEFFSPQYGTRDQFVRGYQEGFGVGYSDSYTGKEFRAARESRALAWSLRETLPGEPHPDGNFDEAFSKGYKQGVTNGLQQARLDQSFSPETSGCDAKDEVKNDPTNPYCRAYALGYQWGYSDGYNNQRTPDREVRTAKDGR